jgi:hypothetical protein
MGDFGEFHQKLTPRGTPLQHSPERFPLNSRELPLVTLGKNKSMAVRRYGSGAAQ